MPPFTLGRQPVSPDDAHHERAPSPDWRQADPAWIKRTLHHALALPSGGWYVLDASRAIGAEPRRYLLAGTAYVVWRDGDGIRVGPDACPHMGASLAEGRLSDGRIVCPWHGLALGQVEHGGWKPLVTHDDGVLSWARRYGDDAPTDRPILTERPSRYLDSVLRVEARCEPEDVIANRLDAWHGVHFHPHSFQRLRVLHTDEASITVRVVYRVLGSVGVEVVARFHCPDPRTIVMTIVDGEGVGSVVETHATPLARHMTAIIEATLATSDRPGFFGVTSMAARWLRPLMRRRAERLWADDAAYAERRYALRRGEIADGDGAP